MGELTKKQIEHKEKLLKQATDLRHILMMLWKIS